MISLESTLSYFTGIIQSIYYKKLYKVKSQNQNKKYKK
jgi:hypothetical protein